MDAKAGTRMQSHGKHNVADHPDPDEQLAREDLAVLDEEIDNSLADRIVLAQAEGAAEGSAATPAGSSASTADAAADANVAPPADDSIHEGLLIASVVGAIGIAGAVGGGGSSAPPPPPDTTPPVAPTLALAADTGIAGDGITSNGRVNVTGLEPGATWQYSTDGGTNWTAGAGASFTLAGDGLKNVIVRQTDAAGNVSPNSAALAFTLDTTAPTTSAAITAVADNVAPIIANVTNGGTTNDTSLALSGTVSVALAAGEVVAVYDGATRLGTAIVTGTNWTYLDTTLANGNSVSYTVRVEDAAGNRGTASAAFTATIDTVAPAAPVINPVATDNIINAAEQGVAITGTAEANSTVNLTIGAGNVRTVTTNGAGTWTYTLVAADITAMGQGPETLSATATDAAGNVSAAGTRTINVDTVAPAMPGAPAVAENAGGGINAVEAANGTPVVVDLTGTGALAGDVLTVNWGIQTVNYTLLAADILANSATVTVPAGTITAQGNGAFVVSAFITDAAGNVGAGSANTPVTVDTVAPTATVATVAFSADTGVSATDFITATAAQNLSGTYTGVIGAGETLEVSLDNGATWTAATAAGGNWTLNGQTLTASNTLQARVTDTAGNSSAALSQAYVLDTTAPTTTSTIDTVIDNYGVNQGPVANGGTTDDTSLVIGGTPSAVLAADEVVAVYDGATRLGLATIGGLRTSWTYTDTTLANGDVANYTVRVEDASGNQGAASGVFTVTISAPTATAAITTVTDNIAPVVGPLASGDRTNDPSLDLSGSITGVLGGGEVVAVYDGAVKLGNATVAGATWTYADTRVLASGTPVSYTVVVENAAGDQGLMSIAFAATIDTVAPVAPTLALAADTGAVGDSITSNGQVNVTGLEPGASWEYLIDLGAWTAGTGSSVTLTGDGPRSVVVRQTDAAGNVSVSSAPLMFVLDTTVAQPTLALAADTGASAVDGITNNGQVNVTGLEAGATWQYSTNAGVSWTTGTGTSFTLAGDGAKSAIVRQTDVAGNVSVNSAPLAFTLDATVPTPTGALHTELTTNDSVSLEFAEAMVVNSNTAGMTMLMNGVTPMTLGTATLATTFTLNDTVVVTTNTGLTGADYVLIDYNGGGGNITDVAGNALQPLQGVIGGSGPNVLNMSAFVPSYGLLYIAGKSGDDTITGTNSSDSIQGGRGIDTINGGGSRDYISVKDGGVGPTPAVDTVVLMQGESGATYYDIITDFDVTGLGGANNDQLDLRSNNIAAPTVGYFDGVNAGTVWSHSIGTGGIVTFGSTNAGTPMMINAGNLNNALTYLRTNLTQPGETVAFAADTNGDSVNDALFVYQNAAGWDIVAQLDGIPTATLGTTAGTGVVRLWDHTAPEIEGASFAGNTLTLNYSENIHAVAGTPGSILLNGAGANIAAGATITGGNVLNVTTSTGMAQTDWLLMTTGSDFADASGNASIAQTVAFGGSGDNGITVTPAMNVSMIMGNAGNDTITATAAAERIEGGIGADTINSGGGADTFNFAQGDSTVVAFANGGVAGVLDNGDTFTFAGLVADVINGAATGQTIVLDQLNDTTGNMTYVASPGNGLVGDQQFTAVKGNYAAGVFTVNAGGADWLGVYDGDATAGVSQTALVLSGAGALTLNAVGNTVYIV